MKSLKNRSQPCMSQIVLLLTAIWWMSAPLDYIDVAAIVLAISDISSGKIEEIEATGFQVSPLYRYT